MKRAIKKIMIISLAATLGWQVPASAGIGKMLHNLFTTPSWEELPSLVSSPRSICARVRQHIDYRDDGPTDEWATGAETWQRGYGDCEDFAQTVADLCSTIGVPADLYILLPLGSPVAHTITFGTWNGHHWISSNGNFHEVKDMEDARRLIAKDMRCDWRTMLVMKPTSGVGVTTAAP